MNKKYYLDITIGNDIGELADKRFYFDSINELMNFMSDSSTMHKIGSEAEDNGKKEGTLYEELVDELGRSSLDKDYEGSSREDLITAGEVN